MPIRLLPDQIPAFWEAIKYASVNTNMVEEKYRGRYLNRLLYLLLSDKAQCFVELDDQRRLEKIMITKIVQDEITDNKTLFISALYAFRKGSEMTWLKHLDWFRDFARSRGCRTMTTWIYDEKVARICERVGMRNRIKSYVMEV